MSILLHQLGYLVGLELPVRPVHLPTARLVANLLLSTGFATSQIRPQLTDQP